LDQPAAKAKIRVGLHNHSRIQPDEVATPDDFAKALDGASPYMGINLDVGHFCADWSRDSRGGRSGAGAALAGPTDSARSLSDE